MRRHGRLPVLAGTAAGLAAAAVLTLLQSSTYRAEASIALFRQGQPPGNDSTLARAAKAAAELFHSRAVAESVIANLRLEDSADELLDRVDIESKSDGSLVRIEVDAPSKDEARRTAQELTEVATVLYNDRFRPGAAATIWDAPRAEADPISPKPARNLAVGALLGALAGWGVTARRRRPQRPAAPDARLQERVAALTARELAVARRAAQLALREREAAAPEPPPEPVIATERAQPGEWTVVDVEQLLERQGPAFPDRIEELGFYLESCRDVAGPDGGLPAGVQGVVEDVFRDLIERDRHRPT